MAREHGFRIFIVEAFPNRKEGREALDMSVGSEAQLDLFSYLAKAGLRGTQFIESQRVPKPGEPKPRASTITIGEVIEVRDDLWHVEVSTGQEGLHPSAKHRTQSPQDLQAFAAEVSHFVTFLFPSEGSSIVVISQTTHRRDPIALLFRALTDEGKAIVMQNKALEEAMRDLARKDGVRPQKRQTHTRMLFTRVQAVDNAYIDEIIQSAKSATAVFTQRIPSPRGGAEGVVARALSIKLLDEKGREVGTRVGRRWSRDRRQGVIKSRADGVSELAELLTKTDLLNEDEADAYTDARVEVQGSIEGNTSITVDTARDVFTYPVSDGTPSPYYYYEKVAKRVATIVADLGIDVADIDALEIDQCLPE